MYKIIFNMISPVSIIDLVTFDALISYCVFMEHNKNNVFKTAQGKELTPELQDIPIKKHKEGFYLSSYMIFSDKIEGVDRWRKRWHNMDDSIVDFKKSKRRIDTGRGFSKSYDMPILTISTKNISFYFDTNDVKKVEKLISDHLRGIGKKCSIGYGWFGSFKIEESNNEKMLFYRPVPKSFKHKDVKYRDDFGAIKPPYWYSGNQEEIQTPAT